MTIGGLESRSKRAPDRGEEYDSLFLLDKFLDFEFDFSTTVAIVHPLDPNLIKGNNDTNTRRRRISSVDNELISKFLKEANGDILFEIFLRLPNCRSAILFSSVCHHWHALISHPRFIPSFIRLHPDEEPCTFLFRRNIYVYTDKREYYHPICKLFSKESLFLHGKNATSSNYLEFMPSPMAIRASFNDLLLVTCGNRMYPKFYICNPVTKRWFLPGDLPFISAIANALICMPNCSNELVLKVALIHAPEPPPVGENGNCQTKVTVFCSTTGQWSVLCFSYPQPTKNDYTLTAKVVPCNGILYWMDGNRYLDRILALDLFNRHCDAIYFPHVIHNDVSNVKVQLGVVRGALRLLHICRTPRASTKCFVMKVWELNRRDNSWVSVHEKNLNSPNVGEMACVAFHPKNCDVVFMIWGTSVFEYQISREIYHTLGEIQESIGEDGLECYTLVHPAWPTPVPSHPLPI